MEKFHKILLKKLKKNKNPEITSFGQTLGHMIEFVSGFGWRYCDNKQKLDNNNPRSCKKCKCFPTKEGYDSCTGYIEGATSVCCGHGLTEPIRI